jgi:hypothetical protein
MKKILVLQKKPLSLYISGLKYFQPSSEGRKMEREQHKNSNNVMDGTLAQQLMGNAHHFQ